MESSSQLAQSAVLLPWVFSLLSILITGGRRQGWLSLFVAGCLLCGFGALLGSYLLPSVGIEGWLMVADSGGAFLAFFIFSILWKISAHRNPNSGLHKVIKWVLSLAFAGITLPLFKPLWDPGLMLQALKATLISAVGLGAVVGLLYLIGRIEERYDL